MERKVVGPSELKRIIGKNPGEIKNVSVSMRDGISIILIDMENGGFFCEVIAKDEFTALLIIGLSEKWLESKEGALKNGDPVKKITAVVGEKIPAEHGRVIIVGGNGNIREHGGCWPVSETFEGQCILNALCIGARVIGGDDSRIFLVLRRTGELEVLEHSGRPILKDPVPSKVQSRA